MKCEMRFFPLSNRFVFSSFKSHWFVKRRFCKDCFKTTLLLYSKTRGHFHLCHFCTVVFISLNVSVLYSYHILSHCCPHCWKRMPMGFELKIVYSHAVLSAQRLLNRAWQVYNWWNWGGIILGVWCERQGRLLFGQTDKWTNEHFYKCCLDQ